jgi:hypothetical protein
MLFLEIKEIEKALKLCLLLILFFEVQILFVY